jgi:phenylalanyl-tRNA synthetase beta chain
MEGFFLRFGLNPEFERGHDLSLHPNKQAEVFLGHKKIGVVGEVHPEVLSAFEIGEPVYLLEVDLKTLIPFTIVNRLYQAVPRFPSVVRDMALIVDAGIVNQKVKGTIEGFPLVEQVEIFDVYTGEHVPAGKKSLAYHITYRSPTHTLTDEVMRCAGKSVPVGLDLGAVLRSNGC